MNHRLLPALGAALTTLIPVATAHAGTVALDKSCYVERSAMVATGSGFTPNTQLTLSGDGAYANVTTDPNGAFQVPIQVPITPPSTRSPARSSPTP